MKTTTGSVELALLLAVGCAPAAFHDRVLEDSAIPLSILAAKLGAWSASGE